MRCWFERGVLAALLVAAPLGARAQEQDTGAGIRAFDEGRRALDEGRFEDALYAFQRSHALLPSPNSRLMAARSLRALGRLVEAREELWRAQAEAAARVEAEPRYQAALLAAESESAELDAVLARVRLRVEGASAPYVVRANERTVDLEALGGSFWVAPGRVHVEVASTDDRVGSATLDAQAGQALELSVTLAHAARAGAPAPAIAMPTAPSPAPVSPFAPIGWVAIGLGGASLAAFGGFYAAADAQHAELTRRCASMPCTDADAGDGPTFAVLTNVFFVSSLVLIPLGAAALIAAQLDVGSVTLAIGPGTAHVRVLF
jgi:hypothetical protein